MATMGTLADGYNYDRRGYITVDSAGYGLSSYTSAMTYPQRDNDHRLRLAQEAMMKQFYYPSYAEQFPMATTNPQRVEMKKPPEKKDKLRNLIAYYYSRK